MLKIRKEAKIGLLVFIVIAILIWGMNYLKGINILSSKDKYYVIYDRIEGLQKTSPILLRGYKIGFVGDIYFDETNKNNIIVELMIDNNFKLPKNTIASIFSSDLMGTKAVKFLLTDSTTYHSVGDTLLSMVEADLTEQVSVQMLPLKNQAEDLMKDMQEALVVLKQLFNEKTRDNLIRSIESVKSTINNLNNTTSAIDELLNSEKENLKNIISNIESITKSIKSNNKELGMAIQNLSDISDSIARANITTVLNNIETSFLQLSEITEKINQGQGSLGTLVNNDTLIKNLETTAKDLDILIKDINENPKKYVHFSVIGIGSGKKGKSDK